MKIDLPEKTKYAIRSTSTFNKGLKKAYKQCKDIDKLKYVVNKLANKEELEVKYKNHKLENDKYYKNCSECHIEPDWLLINTGSHSEILNM